MSGSETDSGSGHMEENSRMILNMNDIQTLILFISVDTDSYKTVTKTKKILTNNIVWLEITIERPHSNFYPDLPGDFSPSVLQCKNQNSQ